MEIYTVKPILSNIKGIYSPVSNNKEGRVLIKAVGGGGFKKGGGGGGGGGGGEGVPIDNHMFSNFSFQ